MNSSYNFKIIFYGIYLFFFISIIFEKSIKKINLISKLSFILFSTTIRTKRFIYKMMNFYNTTFWTNINRLFSFFISKVFTRKIFICFLFNSLKFFSILLNSIFSFFFSLSFSIIKFLCGHTFNTVATFSRYILKPISSSKLFLIFNSMYFTFTINDNFVHNTIHRVNIKVRTSLRNPFIWKNNSRTRTIRNKICKFHYTYRLFTFCRNTITYKFIKSFSLKLSYNFFISHILIVSGIFINSKCTIRKFYFSPRQSSFFKSCFIFQTIILFYSYIFICCRIIITFRMIFKTLITFNCIFMTKFYITDISNLSSVETMKCLTSNSFSNKTLNNAFKFVNHYTKIVWHNSFTWVIRITSKCCVIKRVIIKTESTKFYFKFIIELFIIYILKDSSICCFNITILIYRNIKFLHKTNKTLFDISSHQIKVSHFLSVKRMVFLNIINNLFSNLNSKFIVSKHMLRSLLLFIKIIIRIRLNSFID